MNNLTEKEDDVVVLFIPLPKVFLLHHDHLGDDLQDVPRGTK